MHKLMIVRAIPNPSIAVNDTGDFIVVWSGADQESNGIYAQRFNASSQELMPAFLVNTNQEKNQTNPDIAIGEDRTRLWGLWSAI